jgi:predicted nucleic-acid-binding Zn-ribbon protein
MRTSHRCPKCHHGEVLFIPQLADRDDEDKVRPLVVHVVEYDWKEDAEYGRLQAYICRKCGYTELHTEKAAELALDKIPGAKILTAKS